MIKKLFSHTAIYGLSPYLPKLVSLLTLPIVTRYLTAEDYGIAGIIGAYGGALGVLSMLGLRIVLVNSFYKSPMQYKWLWRQIYGFLTVWLWLYAIAFSTLLYFIIPDVARDRTVMIIFLNVGPYLFFGPVQQMGSVYYQLNQKPFQVGLRTACFGLLSIFMNLYTIAHLKMGYMGWFWTDFIVTVLFNMSYWYPLNIKLGFKPIFNFKWRTIRQSLKVSLPAIPHFYSIYFLNSSDRLIMDVLKVKTDTIGRYNLASTFGNYFNTFATASNLAVGPMLSGFYKSKNDKAARSLIFILQSLFLSGTFLFCIWSKEILYHLIRNNELRDVYPLVIIVVMSYNYRPMYIGANARLMYEEKTNALWRVSFMAGVISVVLNFLLIPAYGIMAAAIVTFVSYMYMGYAGYCFKSFKKHTSIPYYPMAWLAGTIFLAGAAYYIVLLPWVIKSIISAFVFLVLYFGFQKYRHEIMHGDK